MAPSDRLFDDGASTEEEEPNKRPATNAAQPKKKKKSTKKPESSEQDPHEEYLAAARTITRCIDLWCDVGKVIKTVRLIEQARASVMGELDEDELVTAARNQRLDEIDEAFQHRCIGTYSMLLNIVPSIKILMDDPKKSAELSVITSKQMNACIRSTRSNDATRLKSNVGVYAAPNPRKEGLVPPITSSSKRNEMGLNHPTLARFLCPIDSLPQFDADVEGTCALLKSAKISMTAENLPAFLWSGDRPGDDHVAGDDSYGLFRSYYLVRVGRHIFSGPSSALGDDTRATRSSNAVLHDMTSVDAAHIAYICVQARHAISSKSQWSEKDGEFDYVDFYKHVEDLIDNYDEEWRDGLIKWWNKELFGNEKGRGFKNSTDKNTDKDADRSSSPLVSVTALDRLRNKSRTRAATNAPDSEPSENNPRGSSFPSTPPRPSRHDRAEGSNAGNRGAKTPIQHSRAVDVNSPFTPSSPLTDTAPEEPMPLTPLTNKKGKGRADPVGGKKGTKRRVADELNPDSVPAGNHGSRKSKRIRK